MKTMTTGEGGMLVLDDEGAWKRGWAYKDIGRDYDAVYHRQHPPGFRWITETFGTNWRMTEMQGAIGRLQLRKLPRWVQQRRANAAFLADALLHTPGLRIPVPPSPVGHAYYRFYAFVRPDELRSGWTRDRIMSALNEAGVPCTVGSCSEIYLERAFVDLGWAPTSRLPVARELGETSLMFLIHQTLSPDALSLTASAVNEVMRVATR